MLQGGIERQELITCFCRLSAWPLQPDIMSTGMQRALGTHLLLTESLHAVTCRFLAEALDLLEYKHDARSAITLDFAAAMLE